MLLEDAPDPMIGNVDQEQVAFVIEYQPAVVVAALGELCLRRRSAVSAETVRAVSGDRRQNPVSVAVGDFNRDGKLDLVVANNYSNNVSVLLGNGDGSFHAAVNYGGTPNAASLAIADFNGDGKLDLVVTNPPGSDVAVLLGNGDGTFQSAKTYSTGYEPSLAVGDLNADGKLDLAIANIGADSVNTLLGDGHGHADCALAVIIPVVVVVVPDGRGEDQRLGEIRMSLPPLAPCAQGLTLIDECGHFTAQVADFTLYRQCHFVVGLAL